MDSNGSLADTKGFVTARRTMQRTTLVGSTQSNNLWTTNWTTNRTTNWTTNLTYFASRSARLWSTGVGMLARRRYVLSQECRVAHRRPLHCYSNRSLITDPTVSGCLQVSRRSVPAHDEYLSQATATEAHAAAETLANAAAAAHRTGACFYPGGSHFSAVRSHSNRKVLLIVVLQSRRGWRHSGSAAAGRGPKRRGQPPPKVMAVHRQRLHEQRRLHPSSMR